MTWTWTPADLTTSALQQVRATIGDTNTTDQLLTDEHIEWRLDERSDIVVAAAVECVRDIIAKLARDIDRGDVGMNAQRSQKIQHYKDLLIELQARNGALAEIYAGGLSDDAEETVNSDSDYRQIGITLGWGKNNG